MNIKTLIKQMLRKILCIRQEETFSDGLNRHYFHLKKCIPYRMCSIDEFSSLLDNIGVKKGQTIIVHSSWRALYSLNATPLDVINILLEKIGEEGTLLMPCYSFSSENFDVDTSVSAAGVLSECFRKYEGVYRSDFPKYSMCGKGKHAYDILSNHQNSSYQFDEFSPYSIATKKYDAKVLLLGLKQTTHKISVFHCATYDLREKSSFYAKCFDCKIVSQKLNGTKIEYVERTVGCRNNKREFKKLFLKVPKINESYKNISIVLFDAKKAYDVAYNYCLNGGIIYKF